MSGAARSTASWLLTLVAVVALAGTLGAAWAKRELLDADRFTAHSIAVIRDPAVQRVTADYLADQVVSQTEATGRLADALPAALRPATGLTAAALHDLAERTAAQALRTHALEGLWATAMHETHGQFDRWLASDGARRSGRTVQLDLQPLIVRLAQRVGVPQAFIDEATRAAGTDTANIRVIGAGQYDRTRRDVHRLEAAATVLGGLTAVAAVLALLVAPRRRWALVRLGAGAAVAGGVVLAAAPSLGDRLVTAMSRDGADPAVARAIWASTHPALEHLAVTAIGVGLGCAVLALLARGGPPAAPVRG